MTLTRFNRISIEFTHCYIKINWIYTKMNNIWLDWNWIQLDLICLIEFGAFFSKLLFLMRCLNFLDGVRILYRHARFLFINFIKSRFYAITKSWHAHQKIRLDELIWTKWVYLFLITTLIELSTKPFQNLLFWACWKTAYALLYRKMYPIYPIYCLTIALLCAILRYVALFCFILSYFGLF